MLLGRALEDQWQTDSRNQLIEDPSDDHGVLGAILKGKDVRQDQTSKLFGRLLVAAEVKERDNDFEELEDGLVELFRRSLILEE